MRIPMLLLADSASIDEDGLLSVTRGGWTHYDCTSFPAQVDGAICGMAEVTGDERNEPQTIALTISEYGAEQEAQPAATFRIHAPRGDGPALVPIALDFTLVPMKSMFVEFVIHSGVDEVGRISLPIRGRT